MPSLSTCVGLLAAFLTTISYIPQLKKCWQTGETQDLSLTMFLVLGAGLASWIVYGVLQGDWVIVVANSISLFLLSNILWFKLKQMGAKAKPVRHNSRA